MAELIRIVFTTEDVRGIAEEAEISEDLAMERAWEWAKHIEQTATGLVSEQLANVIEHGTP